MRPPTRKSADPMCDPSSAPSRLSAIRRKSATVIRPSVARRADDRRLSSAGPTHSLKHPKCQIVDVSAIAKLDDASLTGVYRARVINQAAAPPVRKRQPVRPRREPGDLERSVPNRGANRSEPHLVRLLILRKNESVYRLSIRPRDGPPDAPVIEDFKLHRA